MWSVPPGVAHDDIDSTTALIQVKPIPKSGKGSGGVETLTASDIMKVAERIGVAADELVP